MLEPSEGVRRRPCERLPQAARALQKALLSASPNLLRDRKHFMRTLRNCCTGKELVDNVKQLSPALQTRPQAVGVLQLLVEEAVLYNVRPEYSFQDKESHFYQFSSEEAIARDQHSEEELQEAMNLLTLLGPDALLTASLRKPPSQRTAEDLETIYEELLHIKAVSHLSSTVKRQLTAVLHFESHRKAGTVLFTQGDPGRSWYIIWRGSVNVLTHSKGLVTTLHEGDDFGELALVNESPRSATIVLGEDNCHFLRVDKQDFNHILRDVEANTVRLKEHGKDVLVMEKCSQTRQASGLGVSPAKYTVMYGTAEKILEYLLETINLDADYKDPSESFLGDFLLTHSVFMSISQMQDILFKYYQAEPSGGSETERTTYSLVKKQKVVHLVTQWVSLLGRQLMDIPAASQLLKELEAMVTGDSELSNLAKNGVTDKRKSRHSMESVTNTSPQMKLRNILNWFTSLDEVANRNWLRYSTEIVYQIHRSDHSHLCLRMAVGSTVQELISALEQECKCPEERNLYQLNSTGEFVELKASNRCVYTSLSLNDRIYHCTREELDTLVSQPEGEQPTAGACVSLDAFSSKEVANHLTDYDWELFNGIDEIELIRYSFGERSTAGGVTANLHRYLRRFNEIQYWTMSEICQCVDLGKRVRLLKKFIKVAACCKEQRNINSFFAIMFGLSDGVVARLSQTWERIPNKTRRMYQGFERLLDPTRNHRVYRMMATKLTIPFLPFLPLLLKDMTFIQEGNKTFVNNLINFEKMRMIARVVNVIRDCRSTPHAPATSQNHLNPEPTLARLSNASELDMVTEDPMSVRFYVRHLNVISSQRTLRRLSRQLET